MPVLMAEEPDLLQLTEDTAVILKSLLVAEGKDISPYHLNKRYIEQEGEPVPYRKLGYPTLRDFISDLSDTLIIRNVGGEDVVSYRMTKNIAHISEMVAQQRKPKKSKASRPRYPPQRYPRINYGRRDFPRHKAIPYQVFQTAVLNSLRNCPGNSMQKRDLLRLINNHPDSRGTTYSLEDLNNHLRNIPHLVLSNENYVYLRNQPQHYAYRQPNYSNNQYQASNQSNSNVNRAHEIQANIQQNHNLPSLSSSNNYVSSNGQKPSLTNGSMRNEDQNGSEINTHQNNHYSNGYETANNIDYKQAPDNTNAELENGYDGNKEEYPDCKHTVEDTLVPNTKSPTVVIRGSDLISDRTKFRLQKLMEKKPDGFWCSQLPDLYLEEYSIPLDYSELGFNGIIEFVAALSDIFKIVTPPNTHRHFLISAKKPESDKNKTNKTLAATYNIQDYLADEPTGVPLTLSRQTSEYLIPEGYMKLNERVESLPVENILMANEPHRYVEVFVSDVFNPSFFWVILRKHKSRRYDLMMSLEEFYENGMNKEELSQLKVPEVVIQEGLNVACLYDNAWHRGIICKLQSDGNVTIFYYDYGTVKNDSPKNIYFLNKRFSSTPAFAIPCSLVNIKPYKKKEWPQQVITEFSHKVFEREYIAQIYAVNEELNSMVIELTDTSDDDKDDHISDWMFQHKYAASGKMNGVVPFNKLYKFADSLLLEQKRQAEERERFLEQAKKYNIKLCDEDNESLTSFGSDNYESSASKVSQLNGNSKRHDAIAKADANSKYKKKNYSKISEGVQTTHRSNDKIINDSSNLDLHVSNGIVTSHIENLHMNLKTCITNSKNEYVSKSTLNQIDSNNILLMQKDIEKNKSHSDYSSNSEIEYNCIMEDGTLSIDFPESSNIHSHLNRNNQNYDEKILQSESTKEHGFISPPSSYSENSSDIPTVFQKKSFPTYRLKRNCELEFIHILCIDNEGWVSIDEFVRAFTNLREKSLFKRMIDIFNIKTKFKILHRLEYTDVFEALQTNEEELHLLHFESILPVLKDLRFIKLEDIKEALTLRKNNEDQLLFIRFQNTILLDALSLIEEYGKITQQNN